MMFQIRVHKRFIDQLQAAIDGFLTVDTDRHFLCQAKLLEVPL